MVQVAQVETHQMPVMVLILYFQQLLQQAAAQVAHFLEELLQLVKMVDQAAAAQVMRLMLVEQELQIKVLQVVMVQM